MTPSLRYTYDFVRAALPAGSRKILEIGCGTGELAAALQAAGFRLVALDSDPACAAEARDKGVDARTCEWPSELDDTFDAGLFTRSLHHVAPLDEAIAAAVAALEPSGRIIVEDFRAEGGSERSRAWFMDAVSRVRLPEEALGAVVAKAGPPHNDHDLHSSSAIADALARHGEVQADDAAYYFRYAEPYLPESAAEALLEEESKLIAAGTIDPLGRRYVLMPRA